MVEPLVEGTIAIILLVFSYGIRERHSAVTFIPHYSHQSYISVPCGPDAPQFCIWHRWDCFANYDRVSM